MALFQVTTYELVRPGDVRDLIVCASSPSQAREVAAGESATSDMHWAFADGYNVAVTELNPNGLVGVVSEF